MTGVGKTARRKGMPGTGDSFLRAICISVCLRAVCISVCLRAVCISVCLRAVCISVCLRAVRYGLQSHSMSLEKSFSQKDISPPELVSGISSSLKLEARILTALRISRLLTCADCSRKGSAPVPSM